MNIPGGIRTSIAVVLCTGLGACCPYEPLPSIALAPVELEQVPEPAIEAFQAEHPELEIESALRHQLHSPCHGFHDYHFRYRTPGQVRVTVNYTADGEPAPRAAVDPDDPIWHHRIRQD